ncbi:MAG: Asp23/Gls24 family envelope stress response protein [Eubacteriales bacterium]
MIRLSTDKGAIAVDSAVYTNIAGAAATNCFGVKGMAVRSVTDGLVHLLKKEAMNKGVRVVFHEDQTLSIDLHIVIVHGVNIAAVGTAIIDEVRYVVTKTTGAEVKAVNVFVDSITLD